MVAETDVSNKAKTSVPPNKNNLYIMYDTRRIEIRRIYGNGGEIKHGKAVRMNEAARRSAQEKLTRRIMREGCIVDASLSSALGVRQETQYDAIGRIVMITEMNNRGQLLRAEGYLYDEKGRRSHSVDETGQVTKYEYNNKSQLITVLYPLTQEKVDSDMEEAYKAGLNVQGVKVTGERYTYTSAEHAALRELLNRAAPGRGNAVNTVQMMWREIYTYDRNGNRASKNTYWGTIRYEYDAENRLIRKGAVLYTIYTYDKDGNTLGEQGWYEARRYEYNSRNRMEYSEILNHTDKTHTTTMYRYDALGRRTMTTNESGQSVRTVYDGRSFEVIREGETFRDGSLTTQTTGGITAAGGARLESNQATGERYRWLGEMGVTEGTRLEEYDAHEGRYNLRGVTLYGRGEAVAVSYASSVL